MYIVSATVFASKYTRQQRSKKCQTVAAYELLLPNARYFWIKMSINPTPVYRQLRYGITVKTI